MAGSYRATAEGWFARRLSRTVIIHREYTESSESRKYEINTRLAGGAAASRLLLNVMVSPALVETSRAANC